MFQIGDRVVYPMHGAGIIEAIEEREILGSTQLYYVMNINNMEIIFPMETKIGIRSIVESDILENVLSLFNHGESDANVNPTQRYRINMNKIKSGDIYEGAEVIRDLNRMGKKRKLSTGDKMMLDNARQIFLSELMLVKGIEQDQAASLLNEVIES